MTVVYFVRHAHSHYTADEYSRPLSDEGQKDRNLVTKKFRDKKIHAVYSSPYKRAIQTVEGIAKNHNLEIKIMDSLKERVLSDSPVHDFSAAICKLWNNPDFAFDGGESNNIAKERAVNCLKQIILGHPNEHIVIGTHGNIMVLMMQYFDSQYNQSFWEGLSMPDIYQLTFHKLLLADVKKIW